MPSWAPLVSKERPPAIIDVGAVRVVAELQSSEAVLDLSPNLIRSAEFERKLGATGITVFGPASRFDRLRLPVGSVEDPVCGGGN
jgi:predicted PhzF superfamily epimerase YddE/YHI9